METTGLFDLYQDGKVVGQSTTSFFQGKLIADIYRDKIEALFNAAKKDNVNLVLASGLRTSDEQYKIRLAYVKDKSKVKKVVVNNITTLVPVDEAAKQFILHSPSSNFYPLAAPVGYSNHQNGKAIDINVTGLPKEYLWLAHNAIKFGYIRDVPAEMWHWEYRPGLDQFAVVPKDHPSWQHIFTEHIEHGTV